MTKKAQHTPGPQEAEHSTTAGPWKVWNDRVWTDEESEDMKEICSLSGNRGDRDANARLIASAPELLHACEVALAAMESGPGTDAEASIIRAAIAKATGDGE